jgi:hypothetical protein
MAGIFSSTNLSFNRCSAISMNKSISSIETVPVRLTPVDSIAFQTSAKHFSTSFRCVNASLPKFEPGPVMARRHDIEERERERERGGGGVCLGGGGGRFLKIERHKKPKERGEKNTK